MAGIIGFAGLAGSKFFGNLFSKGIQKLSQGAAVTAPSTPVEAAVTAGLSGLGEMANPIGAIVATAFGVFATTKLVTDESVRTPLILGQVIGGLHTIMVSLLGAISPGARAVLSGDDTAVRLAAMYGYGTPMRGLGMPSYSAQAGYRGTGEYYSGVGEYFESGVEGLGNYTGNSELMQAAAGYGAVESGNTNHIDPSGDLDRELTIAEAAAGVGTLYQAAAGGLGQGGTSIMPRYAPINGMGEYLAQRGMGEYFEATQGLGNVGIAPSADTWIPGTSDPQLWAGERAIDRTQEATAMVPAGILQSGGGAGVFG